MAKRLALLLLLVASALFAPAARALAGSALETAASPYLRAHADNPVAWHEWSPETLALAKRRNLPVFVSVGYSACHWCHVMEAQNFENADIAAYLNAHFVPVLIDREVRPDLDEQFMLVTQVASGVGGWPNNVFLTPEGKPIHGVGYLPPDQFLFVLTQIKQAWEQHPEQVRQAGEKFAAYVARYFSGPSDAGGELPAGAEIAKLARRTLATLDPFNGGFSTAPKFPREPLLLFLLDEAQRSGDAELLDAVTLTLDSMVAGGIHDQIGGGFHRYATDSAWNVPHFEKMLYDQALMGRLLVRAWEATGKPSYRWAAERLLDFVLRDMRLPGGGFAAALDADSARSDGSSSEGAFYLWDSQELAGVIGKDDLAGEVFSLSEAPDLAGGVLHWRERPREAAARLGLEEETLLAEISPALDRLREIRRQRPRPIRDDKVVASWNGAMIATLAEAGRVLRRKAYSEAAHGAAQFLLGRFDDAGTLRRVHLGGQEAEPAQLADYAALGLAFLALHDAAPDAPDARAWLNAARRLAEAVRTQFGALDQGLRSRAVPDGLGPLIAVDDNQMPSANALALSLLARLSDRTDDPALAADARRLARTLAARATAIPDQRAGLLKAIAETVGGGAGSRRFLAGGKVRLDLLNDRPAGRVGVLVTLAPGWHVNSVAPAQDYLIPTQLTIGGTPLPVSAYPPSKTLSLAFEDAPLELYDGRFRLIGERPASRAPLRLELTLQPCSDRICLEPRTTAFTIWPDR